MIKVAVISLVREGRASRGSDTPFILMGGGPAPTKFCGTPTDAPMVSPRATKFGRITRVGEGYVPRGSHTPPPRGGGPASPNFF